MKRTDRTAPPSPSIITAAERAANFVDVGGNMVRCLICKQPRTGPMLATPRGLKKHLLGKQHRASLAARVPEGM